MRDDRDLSTPDVNILEHARSKSPDRERITFSRPTDQDIQDYKDAHPEVDWSANEVLYRWNGMDSPMTVESHWSHAERDEVYDALTAAGFDPKWFEKKEAAGGDVEPA